MKRSLSLGAGALACLLSAGACGDDSSSGDGGGTHASLDAGSGGNASSSDDEDENPSTAGSQSTSDAGDELELAGCAESRTQAEAAPANLLFVLDKSGSMRCNPPEGDEEENALCGTLPEKRDNELPSKWEVTESALSAALETLSARENVRAGLSLFPRDDACSVAATPDVPIAPLDEDQLEALSTALEIEPSGDTPLAGATILSYAHLAEQLRAGTLEGNQFVVLLTDGAETCKPSEVEKLVSEDVELALGFRIRTFVIGAPGSENARARLSQIAHLGGTAQSADCEHDSDSPDVGDCHFDMTQTEDFAAELASALDSITQEIETSCVFAVPSADDNSVDLQNVNVVFEPSEGASVEIFNDGTLGCDEGAEGWQYIDDGARIQLCGSVCEQVQSDLGGEVRIVLGCPTRTVQ